MDREPTHFEVLCCADRLKADIDRLKPKMIVALGNTAVQALGINGTATALQGKWAKYHGYDVLISYSPQFIMGMPELFRDWTFSLSKIKTGKKNLWEIDEDDCPKVPWIRIDSQRDAMEVFSYRLWDAEWVTLDIETSSKRARDGFIISSAFLPRHGEFTYVIPQTLISEKERDWEELLRRIRINGANLGFEYEWYLTHHNIPLKVHYDSQMMHHQIDSRAGDDGDGGRGGSYHGLKTLGPAYCDIPDWGKPMRAYKAVGYDKAPKGLLYKYQAADVAITDYVIESMLQEAPELFTEDSRYHKIIKPAIPTLAHFQMRGLHVDMDYLKELDTKWAARIDGQVEKLRDVVGDPKFNVNSPKQVGQLLFTQWGLPRINKDSTDKKVIAKLVEKFPDNENLQLISDIRSDRTIRSTFIVGLQEAAVDGKIHARLLLHGTPTGRLAGRDPNLQNQPARVGSEIRDAFIAPPGWDIFCIDYKQLEFRVLAYLSRDRNLCEFINSGRDIHDEVARQFFHIPDRQKPTKNQRLDAKTFVFRIPYGGGPEGVAADFGLPLVEAKRRHQAIKDLFPDAFIWLDEQKEHVRKYGGVTSRTGLTRHFPLITRMNKAEVLRQSGNAPIQGTASDINLIAAMNCEAELPEEHWQGLLLVHDCYLGYVRSTHRDILIPKAVEIMERDPFGDSPVIFAVDPEYGPRWGEDSLIKFKMPS